MAHLATVCPVCSAALFAYEFLITLGDEAERVWSSRWGLATILYYAARYTLVPELGAAMIAAFADLETRDCAALEVYASLSMTVGFGLGQAIIMLRTWAIWGGARAFQCALALLTAALVAVHLYMAVTWIAEARAIAAAALSRGCHALHTHRSHHGRWLLFCCYDVVLIVMTAIKYRQQCGGRSDAESSLGRGAPKLVASLYRDAFAYFTLTLVMVLVNLLFALFVSAELQCLFYGITRVVYTSFACRIIVDLRAAADAPPTLATIDPDALPEFAFAAGDGAGDEPPRECAA